MPRPEGPASAGSETSPPARPPSRTPRLRRVVLFGWYVNRVEGRFYWKHGHQRYARELARHVDEVVLCPQVFDGDAVHEGVRTPDQTVEVTPDIAVRPVASVGSPGAFRASNRMLSGWARDPDTAFLLLLPNSMAPPLVLAHRPRFAVSYFGSDWAEAFLARRGGVAAPGGEGGPSVSDRLRAAYYRWGQAYCARHSRGLIVAGKKLAESWRGGPVPVHETRPIVALGPEHLEERPAAVGDGARLLYVGHLGWGKGLAELLEAMELLWERHPGVRLRMVGQGPAQAELRRRTAGESRVEIVGYVSEFGRLRRLYREADALVLPSLYEGFSRIIYEAWAHSLPVVSTDVGGIPYLARDGEEALLVPAGDPRALAEAVSRLVVEPGLAGRLAAGGRALVRDILSVSAGRQHAEILHELHRQETGHGRPGRASGETAEGESSVERVVGPTREVG